MDTSLINTDNLSWSIPSSDMFSDFLAADTSPDGLKFD